MRDPESFDLQLLSADNPDSFGDSLYPHKLQKAELRRLISSFIANGFYSSVRVFGTHED